MSDQGTAAVLAAAIALYAYGAVRASRRAGVLRGIPPRQVAAFGAGIAVLAVALLSPLERAGDALVAAHVAQHELMMLIAAPLIVLGRPGVPALLVLPRRWRGRIRRAARRPTLARLGAILTLPAVALAIHATARLWHLPSAFDAASADERVHALQHLVLFGSSVLFWWTLIRGRGGRGGVGVRIA